MDDTNPVVVGARTSSLEPVGGQHAGSNLGHGGEVRPVDEEVITLGDGNR
jgi:hypothetical protein